MKKGLWLGAAALWCLLAGVMIVVFDWLDYWCGGERPRYKLI